MQPLPVPGRRAVVAGVEAVAEQAGRGPQLEQPGALAAGDLERAPELRLDLAGGGAEGGQELGPAAAGLRRPGADVAVQAEGPVGRDQARRWRGWGASRCNNR